MDCALGADFFFYALDAKYWRMGAWVTLWVEHWAGQLVGHWVDLWAASSGHLLLGEVKWLPLVMTLRQWAHAMVCD